MGKEYKCPFLGCNNKLFSKVKKFLLSPLLMYTSYLTSKDTIDRHTHPDNLETPTNVILINAKNVAIQKSNFKNIIKHIFQIA
jgi:hypothetical protein